MLVIGAAAALTWHLGNKLKVDGPAAHTFYGIPYRFSVLLLVPVSLFVGVLSSAERKVHIEVTNRDVPSASGVFLVHVIENIEMKNPASTTHQVHDGAWPEGATEGIDITLHRSEGLCLDAALEGIVDGEERTVALADTHQRRCYTFHELRGLDALKVTFKRQNDGSLRVWTAMER